MRNTSATDKGENGPFSSLLRNVQNGCEPIDALFREPIFQERLRLMISVHRQSLRPEDSEELANEVRFKVWRYLSGFKPDYAYDYGKFFAWVRQIVRNSFLDRLKDDVQYSDERPEDLNSVDLRVNLEEELLHRERVRELESCIENLPERERLATTCHVLQGLPSRITAEILTRAGYPCTHVTVLKWVRDGLKPYFPEAKGFSFEEVSRKAGRSKLAGATEQSSSVGKARKKKVIKPSIPKPLRS